MKTKFKIFGRQPAAVVGVVEAFLAILLTFGLFGLTQEQTGVIVASVAALLGLVVAYATRDTLLSSLVGFSKAALVLAVTFGAPLTDSQTGSLIAAVAVVGGFYLRGKTSSLDTKVSKAS